MRYLFGFALALGLALMAGCSEGNGEGGSGGMAGTGGEGGSGGTVACIDNVCPCTEAGIRAAIAEGVGPFTFDCDGPTTVETLDTIEINNDVILDGEGNLTLESPIFTPSGGHSLLRVSAGVEAALIGIALYGGEHIVNDGSLRLVEVSVSGVGNPKVWGQILTTGQLTVVDSEVLESNAVSATDIVVNDSGTLVLRGSTVEGVATYGQALIHDSLIVSELQVNGETEDLFAEADVVNSTLGQVVNYGGRIGLVNATMVPGRVYDDRVPAIRGTGETSVRGSVIMGHCNDELFFGAEVSNGYNIESPGDTCGFNQPTDQVNVSADDLNLGPLQDNGGPTMTHALGAGSVAIDQIPAEDCVDADGAPLTTDQRGEPRPETGSTMCDVGAFEVQP